MSTEFVTFSEDAGIATIRLRRPKALNALNRPMRRELLDALAESRDESVRAVVLTGEGRAFSVGQDIEELLQDYGQAEGPMLARLIEDEWAPLVSALRRLDKPVIAAVNGAAAGGGLSLALACDIRIAEPRTTFIAAFVKVGLVPDSGAAHMLVRMVGVSRAFQMCLVGDPVGAADLAAWGLVSRVAADPDHLLDEAQGLARRLADGAPLALSGVKAILHQAADAVFDDAARIETEVQQQLGRTEDHQAALRAFLDKRVPTFQGR